MSRTTNENKFVSFFSKAGSFFFWGNSFSLYVFLKTIDPCISYKRLNHIIVYVIYKRFPLIYLFWIREFYQYNRILFCFVFKSKKMGE